MTKPLDEDLRVRVVGAVGEGLSSHASAARFRVSISSAIRWAKLEEETGSVKAKPMGGDVLSPADYLHLQAAPQDLVLGFGRAGTGTQPSPLTPIRSSLAALRSRRRPRG